MNRLAFEQLAPRAGEKVLEAGFGGGDLLSWTLAAGAEAIGIDPSEAMVRRARRRFRRELAAGELHVLEGPAERLPVGDAAVDKAVSVNTLYFWEELAGPLAEFARVLRPGGRLVLCFQTPDAVRAWPGHVHGFRAYEPDPVALYMQQAGFSAPAVATASDPKVGEFVCLTSQI
jgi:ubiquinone/menaquinone biosynthesis C-methylase UbiE